MPEQYCAYYVECEDWSVGPFATKEMATLQCAKLNDNRTLHPRLCQHEHIVVSLISSARIREWPKSHPKREETHPHD